MKNKELIEKRNDYLNKMEALLNNAKKEVRGLNADEKTEFEDCKQKAKDISDLIAKEETMNEMEKIDVKEPEVVNEKRQNEIKAASDVKKFENYLRGVTNAGESMTVKDGQVTIPTTIAEKIIEKVQEISPLFAGAEKYNEKGTLVLTIEDEENSTVKVEYYDEDTPGNEGKEVLKSINLTGYLARVKTRISNKLINNSKFDIVGYVIRKIAKAISKFLDHEIIHGGEKIKGLSTIPAENIVTTESQSVITSDDLIDVQEKVADEYQENCIWTMNKETRTAIRKLKNSNGDYILNKDATAKWGYTLLGAPVYTTTEEDKIGQGKTVIHYGDCTGLAVNIREDVNMQLLKEKYAEDHMTGIVGFLEMDAQLQDTSKFAALKMAGV